MGYLSCLGLADGMGGDWSTPGWGVRSGFQEHLPPLISLPCQPEMLWESLNLQERKISRDFFSGFQCVQEMGNGKANRLYEAYLPENFRRPQTDQHPFILIFFPGKKKHWSFSILMVKPP